MFVISRPVHLTMHAVTCKLTAEYGISPVPQHLTLRYLYLTFIIL